MGLLYDKLGNNATAIDLSGKNCYHNKKPKGEHKNEENRLPSDFGYFVSVLLVTCILLKPNSIQ
jgi:hypothetical protein